MIDLNKISKEIDNDLNKDDFADFFKRLDNKKKIVNNQLRRLKESDKFKIVTDLALAKYNSDSYRSRWFNRGIEPPEDLFWFLYKYASTYGRVCFNDEWDLYANQFTSDLRFCEGYYFNRMDGQGSVIHIIKK